MIIRGQNYKDFPRKPSLTEHDNHYFPLIDIVKLRNTQAQDFNHLLNGVITKWQEQAHPTLSSLSLEFHKCMEDWVKRYSYIDWNTPFPFITTLSPTENMAEIVNQLDGRSAPWACCRPSLGRVDDKITRLLFSDRTKLENEFVAMKPNLDNGAVMTPCHTNYALSKISLMQLLPIDQETMNSLTALKERNNEEGG